jgi:peptidoglycan/xylan/chitin deacetylase (PgdA/CDA1 family)
VYGASHQSQGALKRGIKRGLQITISAAGPHRWAWRRRELVVLMYHRILPRDDARFALEQPGMVVTPETFASHLEWIKRHFEPVKLGDWLTGRGAGSGRRPALAITFDDGWRDNHEFAWPLLRAAGVPATLFAVTDFIGTCRDFWPGRLQRLLEQPRDAERAEASAPESLDWLCQASGESALLGSAWSADGVDRLIDHLKAFPDGEIEVRVAALEQALGLPPELPAPVLLDWSQVNEMVADGTLEVGSHTCHHRRLIPALDSAEMEAEIVDSKARIRERVGMEPAVFCYPNGDRTPAAEALVREHYRGACLVQKGWNRPDSNPYALRRVAVHEDVSRDKAAFLARATALL